MRATLSDNWIYRLIDEETSGGRLAREKLTNPSSTCPFDPNIHAASFTEATDLGPAKVSDPNGEQLSIKLHYPEFADLFYAYGVLDSGRFIGESSHLVGLGSNQASFYLRA